ncbi:MAG: TraR/DksA C4-type zinc finger protein [Phycisphaerae bacterium]
MTDNGKKSNGKKSGGNGKISASELEHFKKLLLEKRRDLIGDVGEMHDEALRNSRMDAAGDLSAMPIHMADIGTDTYEQELALGLMDGERKLLRQIDEALERIYNGIYGVCQGTGKLINKARLEAKPWAKYSVEYAKLVETGQAPGEPQ